MFRHLKFSWLVSSVIVWVAMCSFAYTQEKEINHQFEISGDLDLVRQFAVEYGKRYETSKIIRELCASPPQPKEAGKKGSLSIACGASTSTSIIGEMAAVYTASTKKQQPESTLTMFVSSK